MDVIINDNLRFKLESTTYSYLHLQLNNRLMTAELEYLSDQVKYQIRQFDFKKFLVEIETLDSALIPLIRSILSYRNERDKNIAFIVNQVEDMSSLFDFKKLLKEYPDCAARLFTDMDLAKDWIYSSNIHDYMADKKAA